MLTVRLVPEIQLTAPLEDPEDRKRREISYARNIASRHGYGLVKRDDVRTFGAQADYSDRVIWMEKDRNDYERFLGYVKNQLGTHIGREIVNSGFIGVEELHGANLTTCFRATVQIIKQKDRDIGY